MGIDKGERSSIADSVDDTPATTDANDKGAIFPVRLLGLGLVFAWEWMLSGYFEGIELTRSAGPGISANAASSLVQVVVLVLAALMTRRLGSISNHRWISVSAMVAGVAGPIIPWVLQMQMVGAVPTGGIAVGVSVLSSVLTGFTEAVLVLAWAEAYSRMGTARTVLYGALSLVFGVVGFVFVEHGDELVQVAGVWITPIVSLALCLLSWRYVGSESYSAEKLAHVRYSFPWKPVVIMGVCGFAAAFIDIGLFAQGPLPHVIADAIVGMGLLMVAFFARHGVRLSWFVNSALVVMVVGIACVAVFGASSAFPASLLAMTSYVIITFFVCIMLAQTSRRRDIPSMWLFGFAWAARLLMDRAGGFAGILFPQLPKLAGSSLDLAIMAVVGLVMIVVVGAIWMSERSGEGTWAIDSIDVETGRHVPSEHEMLLAGCEQVALERGLTERQAEILEMLMEGQTYQQICSNLLLSGNTVKSHTHRMYAKLGVHSREEALELVSEAGRKTTGR